MCVHIPRHQNETFTVRLTLNAATENGINQSVNSGKARQLCSTAGHRAGERAVLDELWERCWQVPSLIIIYTICPTSVHVPLLIMKCIIQTQISAELFA